MHVDLEESEWYAKCCQILPKAFKEIRQTYIAKLFRNNDPRTEVSLKLR